MSKRIPRWALPAAIAVMAVGAGLATGAIPSSDGSIHACYTTPNGDVRLVDTSADCKASETAISWNQEGPMGPAGPQGPPGPAGGGGNVRPFDISLNAHVDTAPELIYDGHGLTLEFECDFEPASFGLTRTRVRARTDLAGAMLGNSAPNGQSEALEGPFNHVLTDDPSSHVTFSYVYAGEVVTGTIGVFLSLTYGECQTWGAITG